MMKVTREVIADLWPVYVSGEAAPDTRALVEEFLGQDPEWERTLRAAEGQGIAALPADLPPDHEVQTLERVRGRLRSGAPLRLVALASTGLAFARILADTSWDVSPRRFIIASVVAAAAWVLYLAQRARALRAAGLARRR